MLHKPGSGLRSLNLDQPLRESAPIQVGLITWSLPPEPSGLARAAQEIALALATAGAGVRIFTLDRTGHQTDGPVRVIGCAIQDGSALARMRRYAAIGHLAAPLAFRRAISAEHAILPFDAIEATNWYAPGVAIALAGPAPLIIRNSTPAALSAVPSMSRRNRIDEYAARSLERLAARRAASLISNTDAHGSTIAELYGVPPPGPGHAVIGLSLPQAILARGRAAAYPACEEPIQLVFVGRNEKRKGFDAVIAAHCILSAEADRGNLPGFRMTLVGTAIDDTASLPPPARARLCQHPILDDDALHVLYAAAHVIVAPSRYESFGLVYQEAMAFGRPIVACALDPSAREFVGDSGAGLLATDCTGEAVADALRSVIADPTLRARLSAASRAAAGRFTRATLGGETLGLYRSAIASYRRSNRSSSSGRAPSGAMPL